MTGKIVALLLSLNGDIVSLVELESFDDMETCMAFATMETKVARELGNVGIGCATYDANRGLTMKLVGRLSK